MGVQVPCRVNAEVLRIPILSGRVYRLEAGHHSDLKPAALWRVLAGVFVRVSDSGLQASSISEEVLMPARRELTMRQLRQMLRLHHDA
jgi:hypothetical protein